LLLIGRDAPESSESSEETDALEKKRLEAEEEVRLIEEELKADAKRFLDKITSTPKGRKRVISWLWELVLSHPKILIDLPCG